MQRTHRTRIEFGVVVTLACLSMAGLDGCRSSSKAALPPGRLSETGLYLSGSDVVAPENLPFVPQYPLWSDGATKRRWISIPKGTAIDGSRPDAWVLPIGTKLWKEFSFGRRVETRMIERIADGSFRYTTYVWDEGLRDAVLAPGDGQHGVALLRDGARHDIPSRDDCRVCHEGRATPVLGFGALQLSSDRDPRALHREPVPEGAVDLDTLVRRGLIVGYPTAPAMRAPRIAAASESARAAEGYLFGNCAHCHNSGGALASLGLDFDHSVSDPDARRVERSTVGRTSRYRLPGADRADRITAGHPEKSTVAFRMRSRDRSSRMPPLGTQLVDDDAVNLVASWIERDLSP